MLQTEKKSFLTVQLFTYDSGNDDSIKPPKCINKQPTSYIQAKDHFKYWQYLEFKIGQNPHLTK